jgi:predicted secreted protein
MTSRSSSKQGREVNAMIAEERAKNATNEKLVEMFSDSVRLYQSKLDGNCSDDALEKALERVYAYRNELLKRLGN